MEDILAIANHLQIASEALDALQNAGVIRSRRSIQADLAEWIIKRLNPNSELATNKVEKGWDVKVDGRRIQVKSHSKADDNPTAWTAFKYGDFEELVIVVFNKFYKVKRILSVSSDCIPEPAKALGKISWNHQCFTQLFPGKIDEALRPLFVVD